MSVSGEGSANRRVLAVALLAVIVTASLWMADGAPGKRAPSLSCGPARATTLASDAKLRVFKDSSSKSSAAPVFECAKPSGKPRRLVPQPGSSGVPISGKFAVSSPWAAAVESQLMGQDTVRIFVVARNVNTGAWNRCLVGGADRPDQLPGVKRLAVSQDGAIAWGAVMRLPPARPEVGTCSDGSPHILEQGPGVEPGSVEVQGSSVIWSRSGSRQSAQIPD
jgi:hypothetical protein